MTTQFIRARSGAPEIDVHQVTRDVRPLRECPTIPPLKPLCPKRMEQAERAAAAFVRLCDAIAHRRSTRSSQRPTMPLAHCAAALLVAFSMFTNACAAVEPMKPAPDHGPITLIVDPDLAEFADAVPTAATTWNEALGAEVFRMCPDDCASRAHVFVTILADDEGKPSYVGETLRRHNDGTLGSYSGVVGVRPAKMAAYASPAEPLQYGIGVLVHEFGHVLYVEHSDDPMSVMYPHSPAAWELDEDSIAQARTFLSKVSP